MPKGGVMNKFLLIFIVGFLGNFSMQASYCINNAKNPEALLSCFKIDTVTQLFRQYNGLPVAAPQVKPALGTVSAQVEEIIAKVQQFFINFKNSHIRETGYNYLLGVKSLVLPPVGSYRSKLDTFIDSLNRWYGYRYYSSLMRLKFGIVEAFKDLKI